MSYDLDDAFLSVLINLIKDNNFLNPPDGLLKESNINGVKFIYKENMILEKVVVYFNTNALIYRDFQIDDYAKVRKIESLSIFENTSKILFDTNNYSKVPMYQGKLKSALKSIETSENLDEFNEYFYYKTEVTFSRFKDKFYHNKTEIISRDSNGDYRISKLDEMIPVDGEFVYAYLAVNNLKNKKISI